MTDTHDAWHQRHAWMTEDQLLAHTDRLLTKAYHMWLQNHYAMRRVLRQCSQEQWESWTLYYTPESGAFSPIGEWAA